MRTRDHLQIFIPGVLLVMSTFAVMLDFTLEIQTPVVLADHGTGSGRSFTFLQAGFVQEIVGVSSHFMGGVAFAPDGDVWVNDCRDLGIRHLHRYDLQGVAPEVNGTPLHPESIVASNAGCGMTNHPDGFIYSNTEFGLVQINASTGVPTGKIFGPPGNGFGVTPDPQTGDLIYAAQNCDRRVSSTGVCDILAVNPKTGAFSTFVSLTGFNDLIDGIAFNPDGSQLFLAKLFGLAVTVVNRNFTGARTGAFGRNIGLPSQSDGIAFHKSNFIVTTNLDGTISKIVLGSPDIVSLFASGGGRNDLLQVGSDGCLYTTQDSFTRYNNGITTNQSSVVRICPNFVPLPGNCTISGQVVRVYDNASGTYAYIKTSPVSSIYY